MKSLYWIGIHLITKRMYNNPQGYNNFFKIYDVLPSKRMLIMSIWASSIQVAQFLTHFSNSIKLEMLRALYYILGVGYIIW